MTTRCPADVTACQSDSDCDIFATWYAQCAADGVVVSLNKACTDFGSVLALSLSRPSCAAGGYATRAPMRTPICQAGHCARLDDGAIVENVSAQLVPTAEREVMALILNHVCQRERACTGTSDCDGLFRYTPRLSCEAATRCYASIDAMACPDKFDLFFTGSLAIQLPACNEALWTCRPTSASP